MRCDEILDAGWSSVAPATLSSYIYTYAHTGMHTNAYLMLSNEHLEASTYNSILGLDPGRPLPSCFIPVKVVFNVSASQE